MRKESAVPLLLSLLNFMSGGVIYAYTNFGTGGEVELWWGFIILLSLISLTLLQSIFTVN